MRTANLINMFWKAITIRYLLSLRNKYKVFIIIFINWFLFIHSFKYFFLFI